MVRLILIHDGVKNHAADHIVSIPIGIALFVAVSVFVALCANHGRRSNSRKDESKKNTTSFDTIENDEFDQEKIWTPRSPLRSPKQLISTISNKALNSLVINHKRGGGGGGGGGGVVEEGFGEGGLWQKEILMGVKCQPPEFSGVIYYDCDGRQVSEFPPRSPRSPRIAPSPDFTFPVIRS